MRRSTNRRYRRQRRYNRPARSILSLQVKGSQYARVNCVLTTRALVNVDPIDPSISGSYNLAYDLTTAVQWISYANIFSSVLMRGVEVTVFPGYVLADKDQAAYGHIGYFPQLEQPTVANFPGLVQDCQQNLSFNARDNTNPYGLKKYFRPSCLVYNPKTYDLQSTSAFGWVGFYFDNQEIDARKAVTIVMKYYVTFFNLK